MQPTRPLLLVVDDDVDACRNLADILDDMGYKADIAHDGPSALKKIRELLYRVAVLDYRMPGMDGLTLCREIRNLSAGTVAIIVTAYAGGIPADDFLNAGAKQVMRKPVDVRELLDVIQRLLPPCDPV
jgi:two-component system, NtrC family, response regulator HydG